MPKKMIEVKYEPTEKQLLAHNSTERYLLYGGALRGGKTVWLCNEAIYLSLRFNGNAGFLCRSVLDDFKRTTLPTLLDYLPAESIIEHNKGERFLRLINGSMIYYGGLGDDQRTRERLGGLELGWFGVDQAEEIRESQFNLLCTRLCLPLKGIHYHGYLTANPQPGWLRDKFIDNVEEGYKFIPALPRDNPYLPADYEIEQRKRLPEALVKQLMDGDWDVDQASNYLIPYSLIRASINRKVDETGLKVAGVDVSRYGDDETVFLLRQGSKVQFIKSWAHQDTQFSAGLIASLIREHKPVVTFIDSIGVGAGVFDPLRVEGFAVKEVNVGEQALDNRSFLNRRAEYYTWLAKRFEKGEISIPDEQKLTSQLAGLKYFYRNTKLMMESKESMKRRGLKSPDFADALMLSFIEPSSAMSQIIPVTYFG